ncbi:hypothetical protein IFM89_002190 [Coptis chinensis]|uniref:THO complex subunit 6 n=1 Tax=Coptis chinensis TaxID=261450 RepID=A0A835M3F6_9MAGN|nr:hypothetical protein IFM89_002190 [Coptis chinensis]
MDARKWDEEEYKSSILKERELQSLTVFRTVFAPCQNLNTPEIIVAASSDGSIAPYSISSSISSYKSASGYLVAEPICLLRGHDGPAYDVKFYDDSLLLSCGDDGRIQGWKWNQLLDSEIPISTMQGKDMEPILNLVNPQHKGPWGALSPIPENNAIAIDSQGGSIFSAAGDSFAYCWDVETTKIKMVFKGHSDYLHCIAARNSSNQVFLPTLGPLQFWFSIVVPTSHPVLQTEDTSLSSSLKSAEVTAKGGLVGALWGEDLTYKSIYNSKAYFTICSDGRPFETAAFSSGKTLSIWNLPASEPVTRVVTGYPIQDLLFDENQILAVGAEPVLSRFDMNGTTLSQINCAPQSGFSVSLHSCGVTAVGGYGGLVDIISQFGSHLCTFCCRGR